MRAADARTVRRRFLFLRGLRWLPTGLFIPVLVLLLLDRGLTLAQIGLAAAAQGLVAMLLEVPTGGLADAWGRRRVLLVADVFDLAAMGVLLVADSLVEVAGAFVMFGVFRALESGPLDAWYVDAAQAADPDADIEGGLAAGGTVIGVAIAVGTLLSGGLVAWAPLPGVAALLVPLLVSMALRAVDIVALAILLDDGVPAPDPAGDDPTAGVTAVVTAAARAIRGSRVLGSLLAVEVLWGLGMVAFESFTPARLGELLADVDTAASVFGPASAVGWLAYAAAAAAVPRLTRRTTAATAAALLRLAQGATVVVLALAGPVGVVTAFVATMAVHGAANPIHQGILHRTVTNPRMRATVVSANSMSAQVGGMIGGIGLGWLAGATTLSTATVVGAVVLAAAAPLYLRREGPEPGAVRATSAA